MLACGNLARLLCCGLSISAVIMFLHHFAEFILPLSGMPDKPTFAISAGWSLSGFVSAGIQHLSSLEIHIVLLPSLPYSPPGCGILAGLALPHPVTAVRLAVLVSIVATFLMHAFLRYTHFDLAFSILLSSWVCGQLAGSTPLCTAYLSLSGLFLPTFVACFVCVSCCLVCLSFQFDTLCSFCWTLFVGPCVNCQTT